jgi:hypothetical protein
VATEYYALTIEGVLTTSYRENVLSFQGSGLTADNTAVNGASLISAWQASIQAAWLACVPPDYALTQLTARRISSSPSVVVKSQYQSFAVTGTRGTAAASQNLAPVIFLIPPTGVKSGGKIFMPAVDVADVNNNAYAGGYLTATSALLSAMIAPFSASGINWQLAVWSRRLRVGHLILSFSRSPRFGFQGKRRKPVGGV